MDDLISRQAAIKTVLKNWGHSIPHLTDELNDIPPADVRENVKGEWVTINDISWSGGGYVKCSNCDYGYSFGAYHEPDEFNFCPNCCADMRGGS